jgi:hypothetical protein
VDARHAKKTQYGVQTWWESKKKGNQSENEIKIALSHEAESFFPSLIYTLSYTPIYGSRYTPIQ